MNPGSVVILHLSQPAEKYWGILEALGPAGVTLRGVNLSSFDDWLRAILKEEIPSLALTTAFYPLHRVERMSLDEPMGEVESLAQRFERLVGTTLESYLGIGSSDLGTTH